MSDKNKWFPASVEPDENKPIWIETTRKELHPYRHARLVKWNYVERWCYATPPPLPEPDPEPEFREGELVITKAGYYGLYYGRDLFKGEGHLYKNPGFSGPSYTKDCRRPTDAELREMGLMRIKEDE